MTAAVVHGYYEDKRPSVIFYDLVESLYRPIEPEVAFYLDLAKAISTPILEAGCGTGRISWALAEAGRDVIGVDIAPAMLERAQKKNMLYPGSVAQRVRFLPGDACAIDLGRQFDLILAPYRVFNLLLTRKSRQAFLLNMKRHLSPGGRFVFDTAQPAVETEAGGDSRGLTVDLPHLGMNLGHRVVGFDTDGRSRTTRIDFCYTLKTASGAVFDHVDRLVAHWTSAAEVRLMLEKAGFRVAAEYQDFNRSPPQDGGDRVWVVEAAG